MHATNSAVHDRRRWWEQRSVRSSADGAQSSSCCVREGHSPRAEQHGWCRLNDGRHPYKLGHQRGTFGARLAVFCPVGGGMGSELCDSTLWLERCKPSSGMVILRQRCPLSSSALQTHGAFHSPKTASHLTFQGNTHQPVRDFCV